MREPDCIQLTLFPVDSPASRFPVPGSAEAGRMTVTSGRKWSGLSRNSGQLGLLEKMLLESSDWHSTVCYLTWRAKDTPHGHFLYQLRASVPRTRDTAQPLWPTPKAHPRGDCQSERRRRSPDLASAVMSAAPRARDCRTGQASRWEDSRRSRNLNGQAAMYPTPVAGKLCGGSNSVKVLERLREKNCISGEEERSMKAGSGGKLNPEWVEWLMGFPTGWTDLNV